MNLSTLLLVVSIILFVLFSLAGFGVITLAHPDGYLGAGLAFFAAAHLPLP